jgi:flavin reductase (DIM6/NTAB) family NADH-FMN oxidoreductase RutF
MFSSSGLKHSLLNAEQTGEFVASLTTYELREELNITSAMVGAEVSEPELAQLKMVPSVAVRPPRALGGAQRSRAHQRNEVKRANESARCA